MKTILFICGHNAGRSQIAPAYFNFINTNPEYIAVSAGINPQTSINPIVKEVLNDHNIPTQLLCPKIFTPQMEKKSVQIYTMGCNVDPSVFSNPLSVIDLGIEDPHGKSKDVVQKIYTNIIDIIDTKILPNLS